MKILLKFGVITSLILGTQFNWFLLLFFILMVFMLLESLKKHKSDIRPWEKESKQINTMEEWHEREDR